MSYLQYDNLFCHETTCAETRVERKKDALVALSTNLVFSEGLNVLCLTLNYEQELFMRFFRVKQTVGKSI